MAEEGKKKAVSYKH